MFSIRLTTNQNIWRNLTGEETVLIKHYIMKHPDISNKPSHLIRRRQGGIRGTATRRKSWLMWR